MSAYSDDRALMAALGLKTSWGGNGFWDSTEGWVDLGTVRVDHETEVTVAVYALPAQFWQFTFNETVITTGSGKFLDYWPLVKEYVRRGLTAEVRRQAKRDMFVIQTKEVA